MSAASHGTTPYYYVPHSSSRPVMASIGLFFVILGAGQWIVPLGALGPSLLAWFGGFLFFTAGSAMLWLRPMLVCMAAKLT